MVASSTLYAVFGLVAASLADGHIAMWNKGLFGYNYPDRGDNKTQNWNTNAVVSPLRKFDNLTEERWFAHGMRDLAPKEGDFMELVSGSNFTGELACNRAWTHMRHPSMAKDKFNYYACPDKGPLHTANTYGSKPTDKWFGGTALAIAYTSDEWKVKPTEFTVISVNYSSVWTREVVYQIPEGMPTCPSGGCLCTWNWIHQSGNGEGYGQEMYNNLLRCTVSGKTTSKKIVDLAKPQVPVMCVNNTGACVKGPKQPMYTFQLTGNNISPDPPAPPSYNNRYGFADGAQTDIYTLSAGLRSTATSWTALLLPIMVAILLTITA